MKQSEQIQALSIFGELLTNLGSSNAWNGYSCGITENEYLELEKVINKQFVLNGWFTKTSVCNSLKALGSWLNNEQLSTWANAYMYTDTPKKVGIIMAGNIPLVGFHDFLCVLLSGNHPVIKLSSDDNTLFPALLNALIKIEPQFEKRFSISVGKLGEVEALIATGSNNSMRYFESYFGHLPHIFRKNRTSVACIDGSETVEDFKQLGHDIFDYFGLGCRNVSQLLIPENFDLNRFFEGIVSHGDIVNHHKYANNYDYNKAIHLMNLETILDNGFVLLKESDALFSPLAMLFYKRYTAEQEVEEFLAHQADNIQAVIGKKYIPFGQAQCPSLFDYADGVDTMKWLETIHKNETHEI